MIAPRLLMKQHVGVGSALPFYNASPILSEAHTLLFIIASTIRVISAELFITHAGHAIPLRAMSAVIATLGSGLLYTLDIGTSTGKWIGFQVIAALG
ncbi:putative major facilitator superfamily general substrate transporter [Rosellinia necatrix]|uniref:Putative major facilitator superfamily general substrate transporter n=1 Tax=Rosellinia necatrix TaxID=77044 RepID=A0A1S8AA19_ROSNE|nr:putative major facilitator superfamily general substrate transporter [Rosellinia necatrix]